MEKIEATTVPRYKRYLKLLLKLSLSTLALVLVFRQVEIDELKHIMLQAQWMWLVPAFVIFLFSKLLNAFRLEAFFTCIGLSLDTIYNIKLYLVGMFYNLFLPGGVGGDGYKVFLLRKVNGIRTRDLIMASLLDRISGVVAIVFLALGSAMFSQFYTTLDRFHWVFWTGFLLVFPIYATVMYLVFPKYRPVIISSILYSLLVQTFMLGSVVTLLFALNVSQYFIEYYALFMVATIAASLPFTIGGIGAREAVLVYLPELIELPISKDTAVALSLLFLAITVFTSLIGIIFNISEPALKPTQGI